MIRPMMHIIISLLSALLLITPVFGEKLDAKWQVPRDYFNHLSDHACAGDEPAYLELSNTALLQNNAVALNDLGWVFASQNCSFSKADLRHAVERYRESALGGYPIGQSNYAEFLMEGEAIKRDPELARAFFHASMDAGYGNAAAVLAHYYLDGEHLDIDGDKARELYERAIKEGADPDNLTQLKAALDQHSNSAEVEMSEIDQRPQLFTDSWGFDNDEARWDHAPNGVFQARTYVGIYADTKRYYLGLMLENPEKVIRLLSVYVEKADGSHVNLDLGYCDPNTCWIDTYSDNFGKPGSFITVTLPNAQKDKMMAAVKSGKYIIFGYQLASGSKRYTLSLKGSRKAIEGLEHKHGITASGNRAATTTPKVATSDVSEAAYRAAYLNLKAELSRTWSPKEGNQQEGTQSFEAMSTLCEFRITVSHPNTGITTSRFNLGFLDPNQITWQKDAYFGWPSFFTVRTLDNHAVVNLWTNYPDGTNAHEENAKVAFYIGKNGNFAGIKPHLETAIRYCNKAIR